MKQSNKQKAKCIAKHADNSSSEVLSRGEIVYTDSHTIKIGDGEHVFYQLPDFSSNEFIGDGSTIAINNVRKIQARGTTNHNSSAKGIENFVFDWVGTQQEFADQKIEENHPDWLCFITDDSVGLMSGAYTSTEIDELLASKANGKGDAVLTSGNQIIEGEKCFLNGAIKVKGAKIDLAKDPEEEQNLSIVTAYDKKNKEVGNIEVRQAQDGSIGITTNASIHIDSKNKHSSAITTWISKDGQKKWTETVTPSEATANDGQIATTEHVVNVLKLLYPVGSIYVGTQQLCPIEKFFGDWKLLTSEFEIAENPNATAEEQFSGHSKYTAKVWKRIA